MRGIFPLVVLVALAAWLDWSLNDGSYTRAVTGMLSDILFILTRPARRVCSLRQPNKCGKRFNHKFKMQLPL